MNKKMFFIFSLFLVCIVSIGAISAAEDFTDNLSETSADDIVEIADDSDDTVTAQEIENEEIIEEGVETTEITPIHYVNEENYTVHIGTDGLNGSDGDTYNFVGNLANKTINIDKNNTTFTSTSGAVLTNCAFSINPNISGVTICNLTFINTISYPYPITVNYGCSNINITNNNIYVNYTSNYASWLYAIDFNAYDWPTNTTYNFYNIDITDNVIEMYGNSYVCGIYGSNFINSNVLRNTIYAYSDTGSTSAGNNAVYGIALCDDGTWAPVSRPENNTITNNIINIWGQSVYGIEDFGINQNVSNNTIKVIANITGSAYGIALGILDNSTINDDIIYITVGDLTHNITVDMIRESNAGIRLYSNSTYGYYCNNVDIKDARIYYNTFIPLSYPFIYIQNDEGNTNIYITGNWNSYYWDSNPYDPIYPTIVQQNNILNANDILGVFESDVLRDSSMIYVDPVNGNDNNDGSKSNPLKSFETALNMVSDGGTIILNEGTYNLAGYTYFTKSVSFIGTNRENTILVGNAPIHAAASGPNDVGFVCFNNMTIKTFIMFQKSSNITNVTFIKATNGFTLQTQKDGGYFNIVNCSFIECGSISPGGSSTPYYYINISSSIFYNMNSVIKDVSTTFKSLSFDYCSFIDCKSIITSNSENININNSYFSTNDNPTSIANVNIDNWVIMTFENTTELNAGNDNGFKVSLTKLAHADGNITDLEHPELLSLPSYEVTYTLVNGTTVTHTLENLEDSATFFIDEIGTVRATVCSQTMSIVVNNMYVELTIQKYDQIDYGSEQNLVIITNYKDAYGNVTVTVTGPDYSTTETVNVYGDRAFFNLKKLNVGEYSVDVTYNGNEIYSPAKNSTSFKVLPVVSDDITFKVYANDIIFGETASVVVLVGPNGVNGNVTLTVNGNDTTLDLDKYGIASFSIKDLPVNEYNIVIKYNGNDNFEAATTTADLKVMPNTIVDNITEQLNQTKADLANKTAEVTKLTEQLNQTKVDLANKTAEVTKLTNDLKIANQKAATASNNADAKIQKIKAAKSVKKSKKYIITVTLNKKVKGKFVYVSFNGKVYKAKTNAKGIAKITIKKSALKKVAGKKVKYQVISGNSLKNKSVKVKK